MAATLQTPIPAVSSPSLRGRIVQLLVLTLAAAGASYARTAVGPLQETMAKAISLTDNQVALLQGPALALPVVLASIPLGILIDRLSRVRLLWLFAVGNLVGTLLTAVAPGFGQLLAARALVGLTATATPIAAYSLVADTYGPAQRGRANMIMALGQAGAISGAFALGGALLTMFDVGAAGWRRVLFAMAIPMVVPVLLAILTLREPLRCGSAIAIAQPSIRNAWGELRRYRSLIIPILAGLVTVEISVGATVVWAAPALSRHFALAPDRVGAIMALALLTGGILGPIVGGLLADFCQRTGGPRRTVGALSGLTFVSVPLALFSVAPSVTTASVLLIVFNTVVNAIAVTVTTLSTVIIPNELRGLFLSILTAVGMTFAFVLAPMMVSMLTGALGDPEKMGIALSAVCVTTSLLGAITFLLGRRLFPTLAG